MIIREIRTKMLAYSSFIISHQVNSVSEDVQFLKMDVIGWPFYIAKYFTFWKDVVNFQNFCLTLNFLPLMRKKEQLPLARHSFQSWLSICSSQYSVSYSNNIFFFNQILKYIRHAKVKYVVHLWKWLHLT